MQKLMSNADILRCHAQGMTAKEAAAALNCQKPALYRRAIRLGITFARPTFARDEAMIAKLREAGAAGLTMNEAAKKFGLTHRNVSLWKCRYPDEIKFARAKTGAKVGASKNGTESRPPRPMLVTAFIYADWMDDLTPQQRRDALTLIRAGYQRKKAVAMATAPKVRISARVQPCAA